MRKFLLNSTINSPTGQTFILDKNSKETKVKEIGFYNYKNNKINSFFAVNVDSLELMDKYLKEENEIFKYLPENSKVINFNENIYEAIKSNIVGYELWICN